MRTTTLLSNAAISRPMKGGHGCRVAKATKETVRVAWLQRRPFRPVVVCHADAGLRLALLPASRDELMLHGGDRAPKP